MRASVMERVSAVCFFGFCEYYPHGTKGQCGYWFCRFAAPCLRAGGGLGCEQAVCVLPLGSAKAFHRTIHRMVRLHCLLTSLGGTLCVPCLFGGRCPPGPPPPFRRRGQPLMSPARLLYAAAPSGREALRPPPLRGPLPPAPPAACERACETFNAYGPFTLGYGPFTFGIVR